MLNLDTNQIDASVSSGNYCHQARNQPTKGSQNQIEPTYLHVLVLAARISNLKQSGSDSSKNTLSDMEKISGSGWWLVKQKSVALLLTTRFLFPFCSLSYLVEKTTHCFIWSKGHASRKKNAALPEIPIVLQCYLPGIYFWHRILGHV